MILISYNIVIYSIFSCICSRRYILCKCISIQTIYYSSSFSTSFGNQSLFFSTVNQVVDSIRNSSDGGICLVHNYVYFFFDDSIYVLILRNETNRNLMCACIEDCREFAALKVSWYIGITTYQHIKGERCAIGDRCYLWPCYFWSCSGDGYFFCLAGRSIDVRFCCGSGDSYFTVFLDAQCVANDFCNAIVRRNIRNCSGTSSIEGDIVSCFDISNIIVPSDGLCFLFACTTYLDRRFGCTIGKCDSTAVCTCRCWVEIDENVIVVDIT